MLIYYIYYFVTYYNVETLIKLIFLYGGSHSRTSRKKFESNTVFFKICNFCPNLDFLLLCGYKNKFCSKFKVKTKKSL